MNNKGRLAWSLLLALMALGVFLGAVAGIIWLINMPGEEMKDFTVLIPVFSFGLPFGAMAIFGTSQRLMGEITYARIASGKYKAPDRAKKQRKILAKQLRSARRTEINNLASAKNKENQYVTVLYKEKALAEAKGISWEPPEKYRSLFHGYEN